MGVIKDLTGKKFNYLTAIELLDERVCKKLMWLCKCDCGSLHKVMGCNLTSGQVKSCGCMKSKLISEAVTTHGCSGTPEAHAYWDMLDRCYSMANARFEDYGGRGIGVCSSWRYSIVDFMADMGEKPTPRHSLDRIDNDKGYSPDNCKWSTPKQQANNRRDNI